MYCPPVLPEKGPGTLHRGGNVLCLGGDYMEIHCVLYLRLKYFRDFNIYVFPQLKNIQTHSKKEICIIHMKTVVQGWGRERMGG